MIKINLLGVRMNSLRGGEGGREWTIGTPKLC